MSKPIRQYIETVFSKLSAMFSRKIHAVTPRGFELKITLVPHALDRMNQCSVSEEQVQDTVENPDAETAGRLSRTVSEKRFEDEKGDRYVRVVYNQEGADEAVVVTVFTHRRRSQEVSR